LLNIFFYSDKETITFCEQLFRNHKQIELHWKTDSEWGNHLQLNKQFHYDNWMHQIGDAVTEVFVRHRLGGIIKQIIRENFHYSNTDEIDSIYNLALWVITGDDEDSFQARKKKEPMEWLHALFLNHMINTAEFYFDSFLKFRRKVLLRELKHYVGLAIDEFKREEEHQTLIQSLRDYITSNKSKYSLIHVLQGNSFTFFNKSGRQFTNMELKTIVRKEPLYILGLDETEWNLTPLIAMMPERIKIYGADSSESKTAAVMNIFQEKVQLVPYDQFPFHHLLKREKK